MVLIVSTTLKPLVAYGSVPLEQSFKLGVVHPC